MSTDDLSGATGAVDPATPEPVAPEATAPEATAPEATAQPGSLPLPQGVPSTPSEPILLLREGIVIREKGGTRFELKIPEFLLRRGEFVAVLGESGCGKSTLLDVLGLVMEPTGVGEFIIRKDDEEPLSLMTLSGRNRASIRRTHIGYVLQTGGLLPFLNVRDNILLPCRINGMTGKRALATAARLGIGDHLSKKPQFLSGGQRQRAAIARALAHGPAIVLADEPTAAVDPSAATEICRLFKELSKSIGVSVVMVTHNAALLHGLADRLFSFEVERINEGFTRSTCREFDFADTV